MQLTVFISKHPKSINKNLTENYELISPHFLPSVITGIHQEFRGNVYFKKSCSWLIFNKNCTNPVCFIVKHIFLFINNKKLFINLLAQMIIRNSWFFLFPHSTFLSPAADGCSFVNRISHERQGRFCWNFQIGSIRCAFTTVYILESIQLKMAATANQYWSMQKHL